MDGIDVEIGFASGRQTEADPNGHSRGRRLDKYPPGRPGPVAVRLAPFHLIQTDLTSRSIVLDNGEIDGVGRSGEVVTHLAGNQISGVGQDRDGIGKDKGGSSAGNISGMDLRC